MILVILVKLLNYIDRLINEDLFKQESVVIRDNFDISNFKLQVKEIFKRYEGIRGRGEGREERKKGGGEGGRS